MFHMPVSELLTARTLRSPPDRYSTLYTPEHFNVKPSKP